MLTTDQNEQKAPQVRAAMYVRSAAYNDDILCQQAELLEAYAARHDLCIVRRYVEGGKPYSRPDGLKALMDVIQTGAADFSVILLRDCTRWGRFQDADVSAYYEYTCLRAGIKVRYVIEETGNSFPETSSPSPTAYCGGAESVLNR